MLAFRRAAVCAVSLLSIAGCQVCVPNLKKACPSECGSEIHVQSPKQKIVVHRDDCEQEAPCPPTRPSQPAAPQNAPSSTPSNAPAAAPAAMQQVMMQQQVASPAGFAAIPTLPTNTAITLSFDVIKIPIPIPRLRTVDVPPETRMSFVQLGGASAVGAVGAPAFAGMPMGVTQPAFVQPAAAVQDECIRPEHIAAAAALVRQRRAAGQSGADSAAAPADPETAAQLEALKKRLADTSKRFETIEKLADKLPCPDDDAGWGPPKKK